MDLAFLASQKHEKRKNISQSHFEPYVSALSRVQIMRDSSIMQQWTKQISANQISANGQLLARLIVVASPWDNAPREILPGLLTDFHQYSRQKSRPLERTGNKIKSVFNDFTLQ